MHIGGKLGIPKRHDDFTEMTTLFVYRKYSSLITPLSYSVIVLVWTVDTPPTRIAAGHGWLSENNYLTSIVLM
jgi:hypothetical protein